jgi:WhiB family transcriptional regulator, redox-sensing transcriptional regulator
MPRNVRPTGLARREGGSRCSLTSAGWHTLTEVSRKPEDEESEVTMTALDNRAAGWSRAACATADPDLFFPISTAGPAARQVARAKAICARCQIRQECLVYALDAGSVQGIWGGTTESERQSLRRRRARARLDREQTAARALVQAR